MRTAYRLLDYPMDELDDLYIGTVDFQTFDASEMVDYIKDMDEPDIDNLYCVNVYPANDEFFKLGEGDYYKPTQFVEMIEGKTT